ncbi:MAG: type II toxin-antitoxin system PemK/MazF family toxin [Deltaproteobacteria bacterium]|nr:type II toxin-antitoxin system PemK/MazF family toxin [Deltaproteobacteria bacterium]MBW2083678.1 type II toxin-antitoxin system PemK/MazF family toxin [Deltaproteobacteria bacterium]
MIEQGEIYWVDLGAPRGSSPGHKHPHIVIQNNVFNASKINTVVVCVITSNLRRAKSPGNVVIEKGEANMPKKSVVNVTQLYTVDKRDLLDRIGKVSKEKLEMILEGVKLVLEPRRV